MTTVYRRTETLVEIEGCNGAWFTISGPDQGDRGVELASGLDQLYEVMVRTIRLQHAFQKGSDYGGKRIDHSLPVFSVYVSGFTGDDWEDNDSTWRLAWDYEADTKIWFTTGQSRRWLSLRLFETPKIDLEFDPHGELVAKVTMAVVAGDPYFYEPAVTKSWISPTDTIGGSTASGTVPVWNPTDNEIWLQWIVQAAAGAKWTIPDYSFDNDRYERAIEDANRRIVMPALLAGEHLLVDTDETKDQVVSSIDTAVYIRMKGVRFLYSVPARTGTEQNPVLLPVSVTKAPAGVGIQVIMPRPWSRLWGLQ